MEQLSSSKNDKEGFIAKNEFAEQATWTVNEKP